MMQVMQVFVAAFAILMATIAYMASGVIYTCWRNSRLLRTYPGPSYNFFLGVIPQFAGKTPLTR